MSALESEKNPDVGDVMFLSALAVSLTVLQVTEDRLLVILGAVAGGLLGFAVWWIFWRGTPPPPPKEKDPAQ